MGIRNGNFEESILFLVACSHLLLPGLELEMARDNDLIQKADGSVAHYDCLFGVIERINLMLEMAILQFQIIQTDYEKFDVYMVVDDEEDIPEVQMLFKKLCDKDQIRGEFTFSFVDYLYPSEKTGVFAKEDYN